MKQKLNYILTFIFLFSSLSLMAQRPSMQEIKTRFHTEKVAYLTTRIDLTSDEADKFWPVYNEFDSKHVDIQIAYMNLERKILMSKETPSNDEIISFIKDYYNKKQEEEELNEKYYERFLKILPPKKVLSLYRAEKDYFRFLEMKRGGNRNNFNR